MVKASTFALLAGVVIGGGGASVERSAPPALAAPEVALAVQHVAATPAAACAKEYSYSNVDKHCVRNPVKPSAPHAGASAQCKDGYYSFSEHRRGTCSGHGGVQKWLKNLP